MPRRNLFEVIRGNIVNGLRVKPNKGKRGEINTEVDDDLVDFLRSLDTDKVLEIVGINNFRDISDNRGEQYDAFDEMEKDAAIAAALKMYADDSTQYNLDGDVIWVESSEPDIAAFGNRLLQVLRINEKAWIHIYNLVKYGDIYLETFYDDEVDADSLVSTPVKGMYGTVAQSHKIGARIEEYVEMVPNPAVIFDLKKRGKTEGFIKLDDDDQDSNIQRVYRVNLSGTQQRILPADKYIHIMLSEESNRFPESFDITFEANPEKNVENNDDRDVRTYRYTVAKGKSILFDVFKAYRELKLMEDSVLLNRVTRSAITRILQIEVGDMPKPQVKEKLRQIKMMIEQRNFMDTKSGEFSNQASPGPVDNVIYVPTRNGNGAITMSSLGGDVDPKSLIDLEYYKQKESGALGIPLAYLQGHCLRSTTKVSLLDNSTPTIKYMADHKDEFLGKSLLCCAPDGTIQPTKIKDIMKTRLNATFLRIYLDNGEFVDVTPDHRMMLRNGSFIEAQYLSVGDSLMPAYQKVCHWNDRQYKNRIQILNNVTGKWEWRYQLVGRSLPEYEEGMQIHHADRNLQNDSIENLIPMYAADHLKEHLEEAIPLSIQAMNHKRQNMTEEERSQLYYKYGKAFRGKQFSDDHKQKISNALKGRKKSTEHIKAIGESSRKRCQSEEYKETLRLNGLKGAQKYAENCRKQREEKGIFSRNLRCFNCGRIFSKELDETDYNNYLSKRHFVWCDNCKVNSRLNMCMNLLLECNGDLEEYSRRRNIQSSECNYKPGGSSKYFSAEYMKKFIDNISKDYEPQVMNHKVTKIEFLDVVEDAYDLEVESDNHTFLLDCGIFVHNSGDGGGLSSGTALTKLDNKYARTIKRIQTAYIQGITTLLNVFAIRKGLPDYVNNFTVRMVSPSTIEDDDRDQQLDNRINMMSNIIDMVKSSEAFTKEGETELITYLTSTFLNKPEISKILEDNIVPEKSEEPTNDSLESDIENTGGGITDFDSGGGLRSINLDDEFAAEETETPEDIETGDAETGITSGEESGFGDFEEFAQ